MFKALLFDVNETLLNVHAIQPELTSLLGKTISVREWFLEVLQHTLVMNEVREYCPFGEIAEAVLQMNASSQECPLSPDLVAAVRNKLTSLPPYADVKIALARLKEKGWRLATLTNSSEQSQKQQLTNSGLADYFEQTLSVDAVQRFKPAQETYRYAVDRLGLSPENVLMVAAHSWDTLGAMKAGCQAALIKRPGKAVFPLGPKPLIVAENLIELTDQLMAGYQIVEPLAAAERGSEKG